MTTPTYRILSLDGGGTWALLQVEALKEVMGRVLQKEGGKVRGHEVLACFDLVVANSGGSLVAAALAADASLDDVLSLFCDQAIRERLFKRLSPWRYTRVLNYFGLGPKYDAAAKREGLVSAFAQLAAKGARRELVTEPMTRFRELHSREDLADVIIMAFDYDRERATLMRTNETSLASSRSTSDAASHSFIDAAHASSNAPVNYFDAPAMVMGEPYWDGAIGGFNNPCMVGAVEALAAGHRPSRHVELPVRILSIGAGAYAKPKRSLRGNRYPVPDEMAGFPGDAKKAALSILADPPDTANFVAHVTLGGALPVAGQTVTSPVTRMNPVIRMMWNGAQWDRPTGLPAGTFETLMNLDMDAVAATDVEIIKQLGEAWLADRAPNQSIRMDAYLRPQIGFDTFSAALADALTWVRPRGSQPPAPSSRVLHNLNVSD